MQRYVFQRARKLQQRGEAGVPGDQPPVPVEYAEPLSHVFERALQQRLLFLELLLVVAKLGNGALLPAQKDQHQTAKTDYRNAEPEIDPGMGWDWKPVRVPGDQQQRADKPRARGFRSRVA